MSYEQLAMSNERKQSKSDELIQQYCPNRGEYKALGDIATDVFRGSGIKRDEIAKIVAEIDLGEIANACVHNSPATAIDPKGDEDK